MSYVFWIAITLGACMAIVLIHRWLDRRNSVEVYTPQDGARQQAKLKPYFRREIVEAKVKSLFPNHDLAEILRLLDDGVPSFWGLERMQLNILKISNGDLDQLRYYIGIAQSSRDFIKVN